MADLESIEDKRAAGQKARARTKRSEHREVGKVDRDPVELLQRSSQGRVEALVPLRYGRMAVSPFTFFRGSAILQAHDLSGTPNTGIVSSICGDAHLMNFGGFATPERQLIFDLNDFDEVAIGPWEWDVKRLAASFAIAAQHMGLGRAVASDMVMTVVNSYRDRIAQYAESSALELWYERITFERMIETAVTPEGRRLVRKAMEKAAGRTHESVLSKMAVEQDGRWIMRDAPPALFHPTGPNSLLGPHSEWAETDAWKKRLHKAWHGYLDTLAPDRRELLSKFAVQDIAFKVVGVGSVGTSCLVMLLIDSWGKPLFLQIKEARASVVAQYFNAPGPAHEGQRVVVGQRLLQAASDIFLGWMTGPQNRHFYLRQLRDMKVSAAIELFDTTLLEGYARMCGWVLARAHAKASGKAVELASYMGKGDQFAEALVHYSLACSKQNEKDYDAFLHSCRSGKLEARTDEDMAADFRV